MITSAYVQLMSRYGIWQNAAHIRAMAALSPVERSKDRGAFFGSIEATANHLLWGDRTWLSRFAGTAAPDRNSIADSARETADWQSYEAGRRHTDAAIAAWAEEITDAQLAGELSWFSGAIGKEVTKPFALLVVHFFNHQTHHRGQIHAMLTAAGAKPEATDLFVMPMQE
ncbi:DinB family protein [Algicella marina]|uniref:Damage-inducible protein DinB n=1 Tax=Algicella marina TaxID=2683284 RepID=A0A6P1SWX9_9RHOB|nr:DinB family protein [Algicella marina]QHQ33991.1 damage-inducible protein DinB [Algicella marina]